MQYLLTEGELNAYKAQITLLKEKEQHLIGELAEAKGVLGCPMISETQCPYPCDDCPMDERCDYRSKCSYLPK